MKKLYCSILVFCFFSGFALALEKIPRSVDEYSKLLQKYRADKTQSIEHSYVKGTEAILELSKSLGFYEYEIDPKWLKSVREKMKGFDLNPNTETYVASPKLNFFLELAKKRNNPQDVAFFELVLKTRPDGTWPVYINQETDISGCTIFDGTLTKLHQDWSDFQKKYPKSFIQMSKNYLENIELHLYESHCSCAKTGESILNELQSFIEKNPKLPVTLKIQKRVKELNSKKPISSGCEN